MPTVANTNTAGVETFELTTMGPSAVTSSNARELELEPDAASLPPIDGGFQAWTFIFCGFVLECLIWGFPFSYGVFQAWYLTHPPFETASEASINAIGTVTLAIQYIEAIGIAAFMHRYPQWIKTMMFCALSLCVGSLALSSFATKVWHLIVLQGVVYGVAGGALYQPLVTWLSDWFVHRRALACSFVFGGSGFGGAAFPILSNFLLQRVGFRWTLRAMALLVGLCGGLALLGVKPRLPIARRTAPAPMAFKFLSSPVFITLCITVFVQALAFFPVSLYIPLYAASLGFSRLNGTLALAAFNLSTVVGQVIFGFYCDRGPYTTVMIISGLISSVFAFVLWGFAHSLALVYVFAVLFGSMSGGFSSVFPPISADANKAQPAIPIAFLGMAKGLSAISGPFVAASLRPSHVNIDLSMLSAGQNGWAGYGFTGITVFVGSMMLATALLSSVSLGLITHEKQRRPEFNGQ